MSMEMTETKEKDVVILAIESSCDETAASVVRNGREVLSNVISSQIDLHTLFGGVVPEIASRKHIEKINQVIEEALTEANMKLNQIDAIGACIGPKRSRISAVVNELNGEKIDIILWSENPAEFIAKALAPAEVISVTMTGERACRVRVAPDQLSLAIGKEGQNARLAARLTGCKINIKSSDYED